MNEASKLSNQKTLFLDRDGVLNFDHDYTYRLEDLQVLPGVVEGLSKFRDKGFQFIVITNQSGVARQKFTLEDVKKFNHALNLSLQKHGIYIKEFYICPHAPDEGCPCRKPNPANVIDALKKYRLDPKNCFFIGDKDIDVQCGINAGMPGIQIDSGKSTSHPKAMFIAKDLMEVFKNLKL